MNALAQQESDPRGAARRLGVVHDLFARLNAAGLVYCHWKSNEHVGAAVAGLTDLDILVDRSASSELQRMLAESGFRRFMAPPLRAYPAIEDYLALDPASGRLVHLHLHYELTLGERHLKSYRLPWEGRLLASRRFDPRHGLYIADPALELVLLLVRTALKLRLRDLFLSGRKNQRARGDFGREFAWLWQQVDAWTVRETARSLLGAAVDEPLSRLLAEPTTAASLRSLAAAARPVLRRYRTYGRGGAFVRARLREFQWIADIINQRYLHRATPLRRVSPRGGVVVVLLGSDGSGKSTLARTLVAWLGVKLDVMPIYFGSGGGSAAIYRAPMKLAYRALRPFLERQAQASGDGGPVNGNSADSGSKVLLDRLRAAARVPWALALSCEKRGKLRRMTRARNLGMVVVCDRFPQSQFAAFNDGPLLAHWHEHRFSLCRALARWEGRPYAEAALNRPDLAIKLAVSPIVAQARRPEMTLTELQRRVRAVQRLHFPPSARVIEINADASVEVVALQAKEAVWAHL